MQTNLIVASPGFEAHWPFVVDDLAHALEKHAPDAPVVHVLRSAAGQSTPLGTLQADFGENLGELALEADVFDVEPLPADDPLLGRHNVVRMPHLAGRTRDANRQWAMDLVRQFPLFNTESESKR
ncbi:MAG: hypothetical protein WDZ49_03980 [Litorilinea sp.]